MTYKETNFRAFYHQFVLIPLKDSLKASLKDFPGAKEADSILTYGYADPEAGFALEVLAAARKRDELYYFAEGNDKIRSFIRIEAVENDDLGTVEADEKLRKKFRKKLKMLRKYDASEAVEESRNMYFLDDSRDKVFIDDVLVYLERDGLKPEGCRVRITGLGDGWLAGTLLDEPFQNFGYHEGETMAFVVRQTEDEKCVCFSNMTPSRELTPEDLNDGSLLEQAIAAVRKDLTEENYIEVLETLRDSILWVPCTTVLSEADEERLWELAEQAEEDEDGNLIGLEFAAHDEIRMIPDILQSGDNFFFPAFSTEEAMGEYGDHFSKIPYHMLDVIALARNNEKQLAGIVINAFTEPFELRADLWETVENMKTRIVEGCDGE